MAPSRTLRLPVSARLPGDMAGCLPIRGRSNACLRRRESPESCGLHRLLPRVPTVLELVQVVRQMLARDAVEGADRAALDQAEHRVNRVRVNAGGRAYSRALCFVVKCPCLNAWPSAGYAWPSSVISSDDRPKFSRITRATFSKASRSMWNQSRRRAPRQLPTPG